MKERKDVINEYSKLLEIFEKLKRNITKNSKIYKILEEYFLINLEENFRVLQLLLENNKNHGYYEIIRGNFEISILILFILDTKEEIEKKIAIFEYLRLLKVKGKLEDTFFKSIIELLNIKKNRYPYNLKKIKDNFDEIKEFIFQDIEIMESIKICLKRRSEIVENLERYENSEEFQEDIIKMKVIKKKYPAFYYYFAPKELTISKKKYLIKEIIVEKKSVKSIKIEKNLIDTEIEYNDKQLIIPKVTNMKQLCEFLGKLDYYETIYEVTSSIIHGEIPEFRNDSNLLQNTTFTNNILVCEIIKKISLYFTDTNSIYEIDGELKKVLGKNYLKI